MSSRSTRDPYLNLADALAEDIIRASDEELLAEAAEDYGDRFALSARFDRILESVPQLREHYSNAQAVPLRPSEQEGRVANLKRY
jgi:hypothetical protein